LQCISLIIEFDNVLEGGKWAHLDSEAAALRRIPAARSAQSSKDRRDAEEEIARGPDRLESIYDYARKEQRFFARLPLTEYAHVVRRAKWRMDLFA